MSISKYIAELEKTKTYKDGIVTFREYRIETKWGGLRTIFPELPRADRENHIIVMSFRGNQPSIEEILTKRKHQIPLNTNDSNQFLFIFVKVKPQNLHITSPQNGYRLGDGHRIDAAIDIRYQIADV